MKNCTDCVHADWDRTATGRLHPKGYGKCTFEIKIPVLPRAFWWIGSDTPKPFGGYISRKKDLSDHCAYWSSTPGRKIALRIERQPSKSGGSPP